jgi:hypothetical protein
MKNYIYFLVIAVLCVSCDNHFIDGGLHNPEVNVSTVDYLKGNYKFEKILTLYEKAGMLQDLNEKNITVFMPTDYTVDRYVVQMRIAYRAKMRDENYPYNFDTLVVHLPEFRDSLAMYIIQEPINRSNLAQPLLKKSKLGSEMQIYLEESLLYTEWLPNSKPLFLHYKYVINGLDKPGEITPPADRDIVNMCQTSGIVTTTGILHVLEDIHNMFYNQRRTVE